MVDENKVEKILDRYYSFTPVLVVLNKEMYEVDAVEEWDDNSLLQYINEYGFDEEASDEIDLVFRAIEYKQRKYGYDNYIYVPPEQAGVKYGFTIWLRHIDDKNIIR